MNCWLKVCPGQRRLRFRFLLLVWLQQFHYLASRVHSQASRRPRNNGRFVGGFMSESWQDKRLFCSPFLTSVSLLPLAWHLRLACLVSLWVLKVWFALMTTTVSLPLRCSREWHRPGTAPSESWAAVVPSGWDCMELPWVTGCLFFVPTQCLGIPAHPSTTALALLLGNFPRGSVVKICLPMQEKPFSPWVRQIPWRRTWQPTPVSCLENSMGKWAWRATLHGFKELDSI